MVGERASQREDSMSSGSEVRAAAGLWGTVGDPVLLWDRLAVKLLLSGEAGQEDLGLAVDDFIRHIYLF